MTDEQKAQFMLQIAQQQQAQHHAAAAAAQQQATEEQLMAQQKAQMEMMQGSMQGPMMAMMQNPAYQAAYRQAMSTQSATAVQQIQSQGYMIQQQLAAIIQQSGGQPNEQQQYQIQQMQQSLQYLQQVAQQMTAAQYGSAGIPALVMNPNDDGGTGQSCHQCKTRRAVSDLYFCNTTSKKGKSSKRKRKRQICRKKYCCRCLIKFYSELPPRKPADGGPIEWSWSVIEMID